MVENEIGNPPPGRADGGLRVLLVGTEADVVEPVRLAIEREPGWHVIHSPHTAGALAHLGETAEIDVLVTHDQAPGTPVTTLLDQARREAPHMARIVLSDPTDRAAALRIAAFAHQNQPLPVDVDSLIELLRHVGSARGMDLHDPVRTLVGQVDKLPSPPSMFQRLSEIMATPDWSISDLANEVSLDVALTGEILKLVNSSFYGTAHRITSVSHAISMIGLDMTRFIVLGNQMFQSNGGVQGWIDLDRLADRSKAIALAARSLAVRDGGGPDLSAAAYLSGMVSEIGLLVMARIPDIPPSIAAPVNVSTYLGAERALFGGDRFQVGTHLLTLWGFDPEVIETVRRMSTGQACHAGELAWYLAAARQLVVGHGMSADDLAGPVGEAPDADAVIMSLPDVITDAGEPAPLVAA
ncbi:MAG: HDOD domain-containing protein [Actinomycetota bacterium]